MTDRRTDRQTDARGKTICLPTLAGGRHNELHFGQDLHWLRFSLYLIEAFSYIMANVFKFKGDYSNILGPVV